MEAQLIPRAEALDVLTELMDLAAVDPFCGETAVRWLEKAHAKINNLPAIGTCATCANAKLTSPPCCLRQDVDVVQKHESDPVEVCVWVKPGHLCAAWRKREEH